MPPCVPTTSTTTTNNGMVQITKVIPANPTQPIKTVHGVAQVLNSKVKIQPKPISPIQPKAAIQTATGSYYR